MATACASAEEFTTDSGGRLQLISTRDQSPSLNFVRDLGGAANAYAVVTDVPALVVPISGAYEVTADVHGMAAVQAVAAGSVVEASVFAALAVNGVLQAGTETTVVRNAFGSPGTAQPAHTVESTGAVTRFFQLTAGDQIQLFAARFSDPGTTSRVVSNVQGRTRLTFKRLASV